MIIDEHLTIENPQYEVRGVYINSKIIVSIYLENESHVRLLGYFLLDGTKIYENGISNDLIKVFDGVTMSSLKIKELDKYKLPQLYPYAIEIPNDYQWVFKDNKFILEGFVIPLESYNDTKIVNLAYFNWLEFRAELDRKDDFGNFIYLELKRSLMDLWDYVEKQVNVGNMIKL